MAEEDNPHIIDMWQVDEERLASMLENISQDPKLLSKAAGKKSCCIFRVPTSLADVNGKAYQPRIVSIGPYHRAQPRFNMIQEHKWRYLGSLLSRTQAKGLGLEDCLKAVALLESRARECYSETIPLNSHEFIEMMVLDGCFILELFRKVGRLVPFEPDDPLVTMSWILPFLYRDFLKLENQIPYFILERLYELSNLPQEESTPTLSSLALEFFNHSTLRPDEVIARFPHLKGKHLLDLVRSSFVPNLNREQKRVPTPTHVIHCVSKLRSAGIKITPTERDSFLDVTFRSGVIEMPTITIDDFMSSFLLNCEAFEQCYNGCSMDITTYVTLMDCLINTHRDVEYLCDRNIIENHFGTDGEVAHFFNSAGKEVAFDIDTCYLSQLFNDVHQYYRSGLHVQWASFKYTYFDTPWSFISALAAFILLVLTVAQTYFSAVQ
ncbi:UPF0481 protein At3g47200-like [Neltuma alba]|uniref:UPF0481 protein At3g47200-like n=1 Tax=Neltuma alba TaxID=207710 RepID=UPI0010A329C6|nr:UPF0481 protein At3g47200-like [Prosopis alba]XP_028790580.1 UPF0481 protein At3g47200-like [Prosopis alba]